MVIKKLIIIKEDIIYHQGHGYPACTETVSKVKVYTDETKFKDEIEYLYNQNTKFKAFEATELNIKRKVSFEYV